MRDRIINGLQELVNTGKVKINDLATVRCNSGKRFRVDVKSTDKKLRIEFADPKPTVEIHRFFTVTPKLNALELSSTGVEIDLALFPNMSFTYAELEKLA